MTEPLRNPVAWFELYVQDMPRAKAFYEAVLGQKLTPLPSPDGSEMQAFPMDSQGYGATGALVRMDGVPSGGSTMVYFSSQDCSEALKVEAAGGKVMKPKFSIGEHGHIAILMDTEGNCFGLHSMQ